MSDATVLDHNDSIQLQLSPTGKYFLTVNQPTIEVIRAKMKPTPEGYVVTCGELTFWFEVEKVPRYIMFGATKDGYHSYSFLDTLPKTIWPGDTAMWVVY